MYNKLFTKILDSSIWLENMPTRIVWLTFLAVMDEDGFASFAAIGNVANRARVSLEEAKEAVECLESPDMESSDKDHEGRRLERVPGGWIVLNAAKHRDMVSREIRRQQTRERVQRFRDVKRGSNARVTPSDTDTDTETRSEDQDRCAARAAFRRFWDAYPRKTAKTKAEVAWKKIKLTSPLEAEIHAGLAWQRNQPQWKRDGGKFIPHAATWLNGRRWEDEPFNAPNELDAQFERVMARKGRL